MQLWVHISRHIYTNYYTSDEVCNTLKAIVTPSDLFLLAVNKLFEEPGPAAIKFLAQTFIPKEHQAFVCDKVTPLIDCKEQAGDRAHFSYIVTAAIRAASNLVIPENDIEALIDKLLQLLPTNSSDVCFTLSNMPLSKERHVMVVERVLCMLNNNTEYEVAESILKCLVKLQDKIIVNETMAIRAKLELIQSSVTNKLLSISFIKYIHKFDKICSAKLLLGQDLPQEFVSIIQARIGN